MKKPLIKKKYKITLLVLLIICIFSYISSVTILYNSGYRLSNYKEEAKKFLGFDSRLFNAETWFENTIATTKQAKYTINKDIDSINIISNNSDIRIYPNNSNELLLEFSISGKESIVKDFNSKEIKFNKNGGTLTFNTENLDSSIDYNTINISIPKSYNKNLTIKPTLSQISIINLNLNNLNIKGDTSSVELSDIKATNVDVETLGDISCTNSNFKNSKIKNDNGKIYCNGYFGNSSIECYSGEIDFSFTKLGSSTSISNTHGIINIYNRGNVSDYSLNAKTRNGEIIALNDKTFDKKIYTKKFGNGKDILSIKSTESGVININ